MNTLINVLGGINIILAVMSFLPCLMGGLMIFDAPGSTEKISNHIVSFLFLSFPVVCLVCGIMSLFVNNKYPIYFALFPIVEGTTFVSILYLISFLEKG
jgi:hypothetical protein